MLLQYAGDPLSTGGTSSVSLAVDVAFRALPMVHRLRRTERRSTARQQDYGLGAHRYL